jgi:hypothetical protein
MSSDIVSPDARLAIIESMLKDLKTQLERELKAEHLTWRERRERRKQIRIVLEEARRKLVGVDEGIGGIQ